MLLLSSSDILMECAVDLFACEMEDETVRSHVRKRTLASC